MNFINLLEPIFEAILTILPLLFVSIVAGIVIEHYKRKQKEKREIIEKIIEPLQDNLNNIIDCLPMGICIITNYWRWEDIKKKEKSYIINKIKIKVKELIENFNREWTQFRSLAGYNYNFHPKELNKKACVMLVDYFQHSDFSDSFPKKELLQILQNNETNPLEEWLFGWTFKTSETSFSSFNINFFKLIFFKDFSLQTIINKKIKKSGIDPELFKKEKIKCEIKYIRNGWHQQIEIKKRDWEKIGDFLREEVNKEGSNLFEYFKYSREVYYKAEKLQEELEKYKSELTMDLFKKVKKKLKNIF